MSYNNGAVQKTNGLAIASLITGILSLSLLAIIFGHIALSQIQSRNEAGKGMAIAGLVLGYVGSLGWIIWWLILGAAASYSGF